MSACSGKRCAFFMRPNYPRGCDNDGHTPRFLNDPHLQVRSGDLGRPAGYPPEKHPEKIRHCRGRASGCHTLCEMMSVDFGMLPDLAGPCWKGNLYERSFGTGC